MSNSGDDGLRSAWAKQTDQSLDVDPAHAEATVRRRQAEIARRDRITYLSAVMIVPSWAAAIWFRPDLWLASVTGLFVAVWVTWQMYRRSGGRLLSAPVELPCLIFQRALLERELDLARSLPMWYLVPLIVGQVAIAATLATNPRFTTTEFYPEGLVLFVGTGGVVLVIVWRRGQRQALELQRELEAMGAAAPARSMKESRS
jgi:hypothetical protein